MAGFFELTGFEPVDNLKGLQLIVNELDDPEVKVSRVRNAVGMMGVEQILDHSYMVGASEVWAREPDTSGKRILFRDGLFFVAKLSTFAYLFDPDVPVDALTLNFRNPDVIGIDPEDVATFSRLKFQVPVLAIDTFTSAEAA